MRATCKYPNCERPVFGHGWCSMHYKRVRKHGDPNVVLKGSPGRGPGHHSWAGEDISYAGMHLRLHRLWGKASNYGCANVACSSMATGWAYDGHDPNERVSDRGHVFSTSPAYYLPLCGSCHVRVDRYGAKVDPDE